MILVGLGANLPSTAGDPLATCRAALAAMPDLGIAVVAVSPWYRSEPQPVSHQPWFVNGVASLTTDLDPATLLDRLHGLESRFGRARSAVNAARPLDLDLLAYGDEVRSAGAVLLPHPRLQDRAFVLAPLADLAPGWRHPILNRTAADMLATLPPGQIVERITQ